MERLQKVIANSGVTSRRKAEELIQEGKVKVNGEVITTLGFKVNPSDNIEVNGLSISKEEKVYYVLNKPREVITSVSDDKGRKTVVDLIDEDRRIYPVGRLDYDTTGIILLTNDGELANLMMHPRNMMLKTGVTIDGVKTRKAHVKVRKIDKETNTSIVELIIHEGRNHQVKKMFEAVNHEVLKLKRERIAFLDLTGLKSGEYRKLNHKEVTTLYSLVNK